MFKKPYIMMQTTKDCPGRVGTWDFLNSFQLFTLSQTNKPLRPLMMLTLDFALKGQNIEWENRSKDRNGRLWCVGKF